MKKLRGRLWDFEHYVLFEASLFGTAMTVVGLFLVLYALLVGLGVLLVGVLS